ncbi:MAG: metal-dependent hydrolase [Thermoplasmata archaeon]|nr:metal-dependent hydrolase [Thermoplasmata archaeon]
MCWFAHDLEPFALKALFKRKLSLIWLLFGSLSPDLFTKTFIQFGLIPVYQHRHVGIGITHTFFFGLLVGYILYLIFNKHSTHKYAKIVLISFVIGQWSHVVFDMFDTSGCMIFFPFNIELYSFGFWQYGAQLHFWGDLYVFFHSAAIIIESIWLVYAWSHGWQMMTNKYFVKEILIHEKLAWITDKFGEWTGKARYVARVLYSFYFVGGLRLPIWMLYVWVFYVPASEAEALRGMNIGAEFFNNFWLFAIVMAVMMMAITYATWKWWKIARGKFYLFPFATLALLLFVALIPFEPVAAVGSHITILIMWAIAIHKWKF